MTSHQIIETIETLMESNLKMARRHDLEEIKISVPRAKMLLEDIRAYKLEQSKSARFKTNPVAKREPLWLNQPE
jgi:hypothetical protein